MVAEGLDLFRIRVPSEMAGLTIAESGIRERTGCTVVGIETDEGMEVVPGAGVELRGGRLGIEGRVEGGDPGARQAPQPQRQRRPPLVLVP